ncbi:enoyl-CoA hydratase-related protein [Novosphingobium sp. PS1R-30]|uniref:Enoyl-CoA hydratase-related protein n=1 Tax=Novosphingobium anseongense TaxID=3133436 RepID=A0ABU8S1E5_9SPHN
MPNVPSQDALSQPVAVTRDGPVSWVTINRPEALNALDVATHYALHDAFDAFAADPEQLICVVTGAGPRAFCVGSDVKAAAAADTAIATYPASGYAGLTTRFDCDKPFIAMVNGLALGGGFEIALACDIVIAAETAQFGLPEPLVGAIALAGGLHRLARRIPYNLAMGLILTSRRIDAAEALRQGLVNEVVAPEELAATVKRWCDDILKASPVAIQASKAIVRQGLAEPDVETALARQAAYPAFERWKNSADFAEGLRAFAERRPPAWTNS